MNKLLLSVTNRTSHYLKELKNRVVFPKQQAIKNLEQFDFPFPEQTTDPLEVIKLLDDVGSPATVASNAGRYFGFVIGSSLPAAMAANWLAGAWDQNAAFSVSSPVSAKLEEVTLSWLYSIFGLPSNCAGTFVTGTTMANFTALGAARHKLLKRIGWDVESEGIYDAPYIQIILSEEVHPTVLKAIAMLGLGKKYVLKIPTDSQGRMLMSEFPEIEEPTIICCQAGNVNSGSFDPISEICDIAKDKNAWVHVDGAFGLWARVSAKCKHLIEGLEKADSWATDLHKWLNVPYDNGMAIVKDAEALKSAMSLTAAYLPDEENREPFYYTPEVSRRARGIEAWAALYSLGQNGLTDLINRTCGFAKQMAQGLEDAGYKILNDVIINQVLVSFGDKEKTQKIIEAIQNDGTCWCGGTVWKDQTAMRISISSWKTTEEDIRKSLEAIIRIAKSII